MKTKQVAVQAPTKGRVVWFTAPDEERREGKDRVIKVNVYCGFVTEVHDGGRIDIKTFGPCSIYDNLNVPYHPDQKAGTWCYPPRSDEVLTLTVEE